MLHFFSSFIFSYWIGFNSGLYFFFFDGGVFFFDSLGGHQKLGEDMWPRFSRSKYYFRYISFLFSSFGLGVLFGNSAFVFVFILLTTLVIRRCSLFSLFLSPLIFLFHSD